MWLAPLAVGTYFDFDPQKDPVRLAGVTDPYAAGDSRSPPSAGPPSSLRKPRSRTSSWRNTLLRAPVLPYGHSARVAQAAILDTSSRVRQEAPSFLESAEDRGSRIEVNLAESANPMRRTPRICAPADRKQCATSAGFHSALSTNHKRPVAPCPFGKAA